MSGIRDTLKGGWHSKGKDGKSSESWRSDNRGINQVAGWIGKGKNQNSTEASEHVSRPLSTLKDPAAFGPPPKHINYHGGAAFPNQITPDTQGLGAPLSEEQIRSRYEAEEAEAQRQAEEDAKSAPPSIPYRTDTTGLSTAHLPPPPGRKDGADGRIPAASKPKPPSLPPRLPSRQNQVSTTSPQIMDVPDSHKGILNQGSLNRLGDAGVSVPSLGIGGSNGEKSLPLSPTASRSPVISHSPPLNESQSRFFRLSSSQPSTPESPSEGTTFAQKQSAFKTADSFRNNPSSVSMGDARNAASTANNFRERHGEQVKSGWQSANKINSKYGIAEKVGSYGGVGVTRDSELVAVPEVNTRHGINDSAAEGGRPEFRVLGKKKPPPPPKKRAELAGPGIAKETAPPPLNLASKPKPPSTGIAESQDPECTQSSRDIVRPQNSYEAQDLDLDLKSAWFAKNHPTFPPASVNRLPGSRSSAFTVGWSSNGVRKTHTLTGVIRHNTTLATTKVHLTWDSSNPALTVKAKQKHYPPPPTLNHDELEQVGDGECWTLANNSLIATASNCTSRGQEPCMSSQSYVHGYLIFSFVPAVSPYPEPKGGVLQAGVARGDVIQLLSTYFKAKDGGSEKWAGAPDHTAVVVEVEPNGVLRVLEQNVGGVKRVQDGRYDISELVKGEMRIFRAVGETWLGKLDPTCAPHKEVVTIYVGQTAQQFTVHKSFIVHYSPYFAAAFEFKAENGDDTSVVYKDATPEAFGLFVSWIYSKSIRGPNNEDPSLADLIDLWILAGNIQIPELQNVAIVDIRKSGPLLNAEKLRYVYASTSLDSHLRRFLVDQLVRRVPFQQFASLLSHPGLPSQLLVDLVIAARKIIPDASLPELGLRLRDYVVPEGAYAA
ncbi:hypothetical protein B7494_g3805 [Chlorociboria aeruginascens]|nr:hypothetical protein B7494_g3805 [Chlorociboria aeruginascens]